MHAAASVEHQQALMCGLSSLEIVQEKTLKTAYAATVNDVQDMVAFDGGLRCLHIQFSHGV
jgi:hypothetical protein